MKIFKISIKTLLKNGLYLKTKKMHELSKYWVKANDHPHVMWMTTQSSTYSIFFWEAISCAWSYGRPYLCFGLYHLTATHEMLKQLIDELVFNN